MTVPDAYTAAGAFPWAAHEDLLRSLWARGDSCEAIAAALREASRRDVTASMVTGKRDRLGLPRRREGRLRGSYYREPHRPGAPRPASAPPAAPTAASPRGARALQRMLAAAMATPPPPPPPALGVALLDLREGCCRAALTDLDGALAPYDRAPLHRFCGKSARADSPWCAKHHAAHWRPYVAQGRRAAEEAAALRRIEHRRRA
jgi:hypothetical protein